MAFPFCSNNITTIKGKLKMRKLAYIQLVSDVTAIPKYDRVELATIGGWQCIVPKVDNITVGTPVVYFEVDSQVPAKEPFLFLEQRKYRIRTLKMCGVVSQGLAMPLHHFPELAARFEAGRLSEGDDVTDVLGVTKYDPQAAQEELETRQKNVKHNPIREFFMQFAWFRAIHRKLFPGQRKGWPEFISKTDETNIQNMPSVLNTHKYREVYWSEKLEGQSASYFVATGPYFLNFTKTAFGVCSRNVYLKTPTNCTWWNVAHQYNIEDKLRSYKTELGRDVCIQGEIVGPGIQGNIYNLSEHAFFVFNVFDVATQVQYTLDEMMQFCKRVGLNHVPILDRGPFINSNDEVFTIEQLLKMSDGTSVLQQGVLREGIVIRSCSNISQGKPLSFKVRSPKYLLLHGE